MPIITFAFLSASELKIKTVKIELCFIFFTCWKNRLLQQLKNNHITTIATVCCLVCLFMVEILWKSILVLKIFFSFFFFLWTVNHWNWQKLIWIVYVLSIVLSLVFLLLLFCWSFKHAVVFEKCKEYLIHDFTLMVEGPAIFGNDLQAGLAQWSFCQSWDLGRMAYLSSWKNPGKLQAVHKKAKQHVWRGMEC